MTDKVKRTQTNAASLANLKPIKKGEVLNPNGARTHDPLKKEFKRFTNQFLREVVELALMGNIEELRRIVKDPNAPAIKVGVAKSLADAITKGNWATLEAIISRIVGKVPDKVAFTDPEGDQIDKTPLVIELVSAKKRE